jgi:Tol biopolymer transport system component
MYKIRTLCLILLPVLLAACAAEVAEPPPIVTPTASPPAAPVTEPVATPTAAAAVGVQEDEPPLEESELDGRLYTIGFINQQQQLLTLDPASGEETSLLAVPRDAWLSEVAASPAGDRLLLAYAPPPEGSQVQFGFTALYVMPADGSAEPLLLVPQEDPSEIFFNISWPLDDVIYYAHFAPAIDDMGAVLYATRIERAHLPGAEVETLQEDAAWPRLSNDGTRLVYVTEAGELMIAAPDGASPELLLDDTIFSAVDAPLFSPDGSQVYFSAVDLESSASLSPLDRLLGVNVAQAHSVPSDWWRMSAEAGSSPEQLTTIDKVGLYGDFDARGRHLFFAAADGIYVMGPAGEELTQLMTIPTTATIDWTP